MVDTIHRSWVEIDIDRIVSNYSVYKKKMRKDQTVMAVVKANAYGHGDIQVVKALQAVGCRRFAVSNIQEALKLCEIPEIDEILILGYTPPYYFDILNAHNNIVQTVVSEEYAKILAEHHLRSKCQFAIDTGMNRIGLDGDDPAFCEQVIRNYNELLNISGLFTHLCVADSDDAKQIEFTHTQIDKFRKVSDLVKDLSLSELHCLNTAGGLWHNEYGNIVRLGISLYGLKPDYSNTLPDSIEPALQWKSVISMVKTVSAGEDIGYGRSFHVDHNMKIATIPTGYADGYSRFLSNKGWVLIDGKKARIVGRVCMDQMMVDVTDISDVSVGQVVTLLGVDGKEQFNADDMAELIGTIGYEIVCNISSRVERVYLDSQTAKKENV